LAQGLNVELFQRSRELEFDCGVTLQHIYKPKGLPPPGYIKHLARARSIFHVQADALTNVRSRGQQAGECRYVSSSLTEQSHCKYRSTGLDAGIA